MKSGFSLIEILIALTVGSILSTLVYRSLDQINRTIRSIDVTTQTQSARTFFADRLAIDLNGAFAPRKAFSEIKKEKPETPTQAPTQEPTQQIKNVPDTKPGNKKETAFQLDDVFVVKDFSAGKQKAASSKATFTFITSNPLLAYGETAPRTARVSYALQKQEPPQDLDQEDKQKINLLKLIRYESPELDYKKFKSKLEKQDIRGYEVLSNIEEIEITLGAHAEEKRGDNKKEEVGAKKPEQKNEAQKTAYEWSPSWDSQSRRAEEKNMLPEFVNLKATICGPHCKKKVTFVMRIPLFAYASGMKPQETNPLISLVKTLLDGGKGSAQPPLNPLNPITPKAG